MRILKYLQCSLLAIVLFMFGCEKEIELDVPGQDSQIVLNGVLMEDSLLRIHLSQSRSVLDLEPLNAITDANIELLENGNPIAVWAYVDQGVYEAQNFKPQAGKQYQLKVSASGLKPVVANAVVPHKLSGVEVLAADSNRINEYVKRVRIRLRIMDPEQSNDYYLITRLVKRMEGDNMLYLYGFLKSDATNVVNTCEEAYSYYLDGCKILINDRSFEGKDKELVVTFDMESYSWGNEGQDETIENYLIVSRISADYYQYLLTLYHNKVAQDNPFAEPVSLFMNVEGGYGILGASSSVRFKIY